MISDVLLGLNKNHDQITSDRSVAAMKCILHQILLYPLKMGFFMHFPLGVERPRKDAGRGARAWYPSMTNGTGHPIPLRDCLTILGTATAENMTTFLKRAALNQRLREGNPCQNMGQDDSEMGVS